MFDLRSCTARNCKCYLHLIFFHLFYFYFVLEMLSFVRCMGKWHWNVHIISLNKMIYEMKVFAGHLQMPEPMEKNVSRIKKSYKIRPCSFFNIVLWSISGLFPHIIRLLTSLFYNTDAEFFNITGFCKNRNSLMYGSWDH